MGLLGKLFGTSSKATSRPTAPAPAAKKFKLSAKEIKPIAVGYGGCIASDMIPVGGHPVRFMYRTEPHNPMDSGWAFLSGFESDAYMNDASNHGIYDVNTIANYDPSITPFLDAPVGSVFEKTEESEEFVEVKDWAPPQD
jgi:hypothetical protein